MNSSMGQTKGSLSLRLLADGSADSKGKGKGKTKSKDDGEVNLCYNLSNGKGCKFGDACKFKHDCAIARWLKRCLACGQEGLYRRVVQDPGSPQQLL